MQSFWRSGRGACALTCFCPTVGGHWRCCAIWLVKHFFKIISCDYRAGYVRSRGEREREREKERWRARSTSVNPMITINDWQANQRQQRQRYNNNNGHGLDGMDLNHNPAASQQVFLPSAVRSNVYRSGGTVSHVSTRQNTVAHSLTAGTFGSLDRRWRGHGHRRRSFVR
uniref:Putative secreted protein n=1 Tax=Anopheles marajoara TaxID=58244 RepID=A0A2M4C687_9DIPT